MKKYNEKLKNVPDGFAETYSVELYMKEKPIILENKLLENIKKYCGNVKIISNEDKNLTFAFMDYILNYRNVSVPVTMMISISDEESESESCKIKVLVTDLMAIGLEYKKRVELFQKALYAIVELINCEGINFHIAEQLISREDYLENNPLNDEYDPLFGILNVRLFKIEGEKNEYIMDTLGLSSIGLCDLQCHFKNLDTSEISNILYSYGYYIFDNQEVVDNMTIVEGISKEDKWKCRHEVALVEPERVVLDINPGKEFSSENRTY